MTAIVVRHLWEIVKGGTLRKLITQPLEFALEYKRERAHRRLAAHFVDIYTEMRTIPGYTKSMERLFGSSNVDYKAFELFEPASKWLLHEHTVPSQVR